MENLRECVITWLRRGADLREGVSLFLRVSRNVYYARAIEAKDWLAGTTTLISEFSRRTGLSEKELRSMVTAGGSPPPPDSNPGTHREGESPKTLEGAPALLKDKAKAKAEAEAQAKKEAEEKAEAKARVNLRAEFPFLGREDCPEVLAVLVNRMLTANETFRRNHVKLFEVDFNDRKGCYLAARGVLDYYIRNREIWAELNYYKVHGKILGEVAEFREQKLKQKFEGMKTLDLAKELNGNIPRRLTYYNNQLKRTASNKEEIRRKIAEAEQEVKIIKVILIERGEL